MLFDHLNLNLFLDILNAIFAHKAYNSVHKHVYKKLTKIRRHQIENRGNEFFTDVFSFDQIDKISIGFQLSIQMRISYQISFKFNI